MGTPFFSVVIPTYNRAKLLPFAVKSVLAQTCGDFEIVISNGGSTDDTAEVVRGFDDPRIRYVESPVRLPVGDNYQQGLDNATGEYITFLSDDDAYTPYLFERVRPIIAEKKAEVVGYPYCRYYHDDLYDFERHIPKNSLLVERFTRELTKFTGDQAAEQVYAIHGLSRATINGRFVCPYLSNAVYHKDIFSRVRAVTPKPFDSVPPDIYLAAAVFFNINNYYCLNEPLLVWSNWEGNATVSAQRDQNGIRERYEKLLNGRQLTFTPLKFAQPMNCAANAVLSAADDFHYRAVTVDWATYFLKTYENFVYLKSVGVNVDTETEEFWLALSAQPKDLSDRVRSELTQSKFLAKRILNSNLPRTAAFLRRALRLGRGEEFRVIKGAEAGFNDVLEASEYVR